MQHTHAVGPSGWRACTPAWSRRRRLHAPKLEPFRRRAGNLRFFDGLRGKEIGCDTPRDRANSPLTERWSFGPARRGAPTILPAGPPAVLLSDFGAGGPRAFVTLSRKLRICMSRKPGLAGACRYYLRLGAWARRRLSSGTTRTSSRFSPDLSAAASIPTGSVAQPGFF